MKQGRYFDAWIDTGKTTFLAWLPEEVVI